MAGQPKESVLVAREELKDATVEDLEQIFKEHGHKPQIAHGLAVAARYVESPNLRVKVKFLLSFLDQEYDLDPLFIFPSAGEIYAEVIRQLADAEGVLSGVHLWRLLDFLGRHPPIEGIRGKVKELLVVSRRRVKESTYLDRPPIPHLWETLARALLRYQLFDVLEVLVQQRVYDAIPALYDAVVEQIAGDGSRKQAPAQILVAELMLGGWRHATAQIGTAFRLVGSDARALYLLLDLSTAYIDEHGKPYKLPEPGITGGEW